MSWPNSLHKPVPRPGGGSTFPGPPANDNIRTPRINVPMPPRPPANDNFPGVGRGGVAGGMTRRTLLRLGMRGALRLVPVVGNVLLAYDIYKFLTQLELNWEFIFGSALTVQSRQSDCVAPDGPLMTAPQGACGLADEPAALPGRIHLTTGNSLIGYRSERSFFGNRPDISEFLPWQQGGIIRWRVPGSVPSVDRWVDAVPVTVARPAPAPQPYVAPPPPFPWAYPPGTPWVPTKPPRVKPGYADGRDRPIMPEDTEAGYGPRPSRRPDNLESTKPPRGTKERKLRTRDFAVGRALELLVSQATEALDYANAFFKSLPFWRQMYIINKYRTLQTRDGAYGFVAEGRLRYVPLTAAEMMIEVYKYADEIEMDKLVSNIQIMNGSDRAWGLIVKRLGRFQKGAWDNSRPKPQHEPEWETYLPWLDPYQSVHNRSLFEDIYGEELTDKELDAIAAKWDRWSKHREFDPGQLNP